MILPICIVHYEVGSMKKIRRETSEALRSLPESPTSRTLWERVKGVTSQIFRTQKIMIPLMIISRERSKTMHKGEEDGKVAANHSVNVLVTKMRVLRDKR